MNGPLSIKIRCIWTLILSAGLIQGSALAQSDRRPNVLLLLADDLRPDCISAFGNSHIETPHLDDLIKRSITFRRATCSSPICTVSRAEIISGMHGWENGMPGYGKRQALPGDVISWPEAFRAAGYETWHVGKWHVRGRPSTRGYTDVSGLFAGGGSRYWTGDEKDWKGQPVTGYKGWVFQSDDGGEMYPEAGVGLTPDIDRKIADSAIALIRQSGEKPWMCHVNFTAPHDPLYIPPGWENKYTAEDMAVPPDFMPRHPFDHGNFSGRDEVLMEWPRTEDAVRDLLRVYYSVVEHLDAQIGRILTALEKSGQLDNTIIIFSSDHGLACGSHGIRGKQNQYEHTINVPLVISGPDIEAGSRTDAQVYLRELFPTTCEWAGIPIPESVTGQSFYDVLTGRSNAHHNYIYGYYFDSQRMIRSSDGWKLIYYPLIDRYQLFDLDQDVYEINDLALSGEPGHQRKFKKLKNKLDQWRKAQGDPLLKH